MQCNDPRFCQDGNCPGCLNGQLWCQDPRCAPYCPGSLCSIPPEHDFVLNLVMAVILVSLCAMLFTVWYVYGPSVVTLHNNNQRLLSQ